jgi:alanyl-tRNA synthetase
MMARITRKELIRKYIEFYKSKGHKEIPNESLVPDNDPSVLFTTAGMHPIVPYLMGQRHVLGKRLVNVQRCIRTGDIGEVGDESHHTFFEMLGNWSLGDYWKKDAIGFSFEFLTKVLGIEKDRLGVSCFKGDKDAHRDLEAAKVWEKLGISKDRIVFLGKKDNWWGPAGEIGPCGPDTEMFYWKSRVSAPKKFDPEDKNWVEIGNDVLMQYVKTVDGKFEEASQKNVDFGGGVERLVGVLNGLEDNYLSDSFLPIIKEIESLSGVDYSTNKVPMRIIADHVKASVFIIADGVVPGNIEQGYVLRRLIRRAVRYGRRIGLKGFIRKVAGRVFEIYDDYRILVENQEKILDELEKEEARFLEGLDKGIGVFEKMVRGGKKKVSGRDAFLLYQSYGFPIEITVELAKEKKIKVDVEGFDKEFKKHQKLSQTASKGRFSSGLADSGDETVRLHTATHLLHAALRKVLGKNVEQKGSNINSERLRFDFSFDRKLTSDEIDKVEMLVNKAIKDGLKISMEELSVGEAKKSGALGFFEHKYGGKVSVYSVGKGKKLFSKEICTGPHVGNTRELKKFKIKKEESSSAGVRRIKAVVG